jgi:S1-C subfamily serine protease
MLWLSVWGLLSLVAAISFKAHAATAEPVPQVHLGVVVALVGADLQVKPVPKFGLTVTGQDGGATYEATTGFDGKLELSLPAGKYVLQSVQSIDFEGYRYSWKLLVHAADVSVRLELSNDNAQRESIKAEPQETSSEGDLYKRVKTSVFTIMAEGGKGTGFLVDRNGMILTNHHVVAGSDFLAAKIDGGGKYRAILIASDSRHDVAVVFVNPSVLSQIEPLPMADSSPDKPVAFVGERVLAVGSPLATEGILTTGIVSRVESDAIISDVNINPGNSGGPLLNFRGQVIGITTFGVQEPGRGPGISGIVRIHLAQTILAEAREKSKTVAVPSPDPLPLPSDRPYPAEALTRLAKADLKLTDYHVEAGKIDIQFITPVVIASLEKGAAMRAAEQKEKRQHKKKETIQAGEQTEAARTQEGVGEGFYEWRRYVGDYQSVVRIQAIPEIGMTGGSIFAKVMLGANAPGRYRFRTDFLKMRLLRGGVEVPPVHPGKVRQVVSNRAGVDVMEDIGTFGSYEYAPEAFEPSSNLVLEVYDEEHPDKPRVCPISKILQLQVWQDFAPYFSVDKP